MKTENQEGIAPVVCPFQPGRWEWLQVGAGGWRWLRHYHHRGLNLGRASWPGEGWEDFERWPFMEYGQLGFILEGELEAGVPDQGIQKVGEAQFFLICGEARELRLRVSEGLEILWIGCDQRAWEGLSPGKLPDSHRLLDCVGCEQREETLFLQEAWTRRMEGLVRELGDIATRMDDPLRVASTTLELLRCAFEAPMLDGTPRSEPCFRKEDKAALEAAGRHLEVNLERSHTIASLSRLVHLNEFKLKRGFREYYGTTVHGYLRRKRMEYAYDLLARQQSSVLEAAYSVGYSNPSHFSRAFRKEFGINPSALQRNSRVGRR